MNISSKKSFRETSKSAARRLVHDFNEEMNNLPKMKKDQRTSSESDCSLRIAHLETNVKRLRKSLKEERERIKSMEDDIQTLRRFNMRSASTLERDDEAMKNFLELLDANVKSQVDFSDFQILQKNVRMVGRLSLPESLAPISKRINETFGDIALGSSQSDCSAMPSYLLFCAAIKEMDDLTLEQISQTKILLWRDAINSAKNVQFKVDFAIKHLKKIARAYFGLKAMDEKRNKELTNADGTVSKTEVPEDCLRELEYFRGNPLSTGLFP